MPVAVHSLLVVPKVPAATLGHLFVPPSSQNQRPLIKYNHGAPQLDAAQHLLIKTLLQRV